MLSPRACRRRAAPIAPRPENPLLANCKRWTWVVEHPTPTRGTILAQRTPVASGPPDSKSSKEKRLR